MLGVPMRRGPSESNSVCANWYVCELSTPTDQILLIVASLVGKVCALAREACAAMAAPNETTAIDRRIEPGEEVREEVRPEYETGKGRVVALPRCSTKIESTPTVAPVPCR